MEVWTRRPKRDRSPFLFVARQAPPLLPALTGLSRSPASPAHGRPPASSDFPSDSEDSDDDMQSGEESLEHTTSSSSPEIAGSYHLHPLPPSHHHHQQLLHPEPHFSQFPDHPSPHSHHFHQHQLHHQHQHHHQHNQHHHQQQQAFLSQHAYQPSLQPHQAYQPFADHHAGQAAPLPGPASPLLVAKLQGEQVDFVPGIPVDAYTFSSATSFASSAHSLQAFSAGPEGQPRESFQPDQHLRPTTPGERSVSPVGNRGRGGSRESQGVAKRTPSPSSRASSFQGKITFTNPAEELDKKNRRLLKNRQAAKESRRKKKERYEEMEGRVAALEDQVADLTSQLERYRARFGELDV